MSEPHLLPQDINTQTEGCVAVAVRTGLTVTLNPIHTHIHGGNTGPLPHSSAKSRSGSYQSTG